MDTFEKIVQREVRRCVDRIIQLGPVSFRLVSNVPDFTAQQYFSAATQRDYKGERADYELWCISLLESELDQEYIVAHVDNTYRGNNFAAGYYVTDHFGPPAYLVTRGQRHYIFSEEFESIVWPYFVKRFLMLTSLENKSLHLKAAACSIGSAATLLLGRGGSGKTVFLTQLCLNGARFISNSHSIIKDGHVQGVASCIRIRPGPWHANLVRAAETWPSLRAGELIVDPLDVFLASRDAITPVRNILLLDYRCKGQHIIRPLSEQEVYNYAEQFSLAVNVYRLEEDLLDLYDGDYRQFSQVYSQMKAQLLSLVRHSTCYYISSDVLSSKFREEIFSLLSAN